MDEVQAGGPGDGTPVTPIEAFTPSFSLNTEVLHSIEQTHVGYVTSPESFTFTMSVRAIGDAAAQLSRLALEGGEFQIVMQEAQGSAGEWEFKKVVLNRCLITQANPSNATINGSPAATFSGVCLDIAVTDQTGELKLPRF